MKMVINGRMYDTDTAELIGEWDNGHYYNDFHYCEEALYRKRTDEYFIHGRGGAMTKYAEYRGNNCWFDGESIVPITVAEAMEWVDDHCDADTYEKLFGEVEE